MARKRFSEREVLETLAWQGIIATCFRCGKPFFTPSTTENLWHVLPMEREHLHEYKLGGDDKPYNCRYSCKECHAKITNGTKATTAGSSKHRIAKTKRIAAGGRKRKGPPIKSRGFSKLKQKFPKGRSFQKRIKDASSK